MKRLVVVGNGMAGTRLVQELRRRAERNFVITIVGAEHDAGYNRVLLSQVLAGRVDAEAIALASPSWYHAEGIGLVTGKPVIRIDRAAKLAVLADGTALPYDVLVLATGSRAWMPPVPGLHRPNVDAPSPVDAPPPVDHGEVVASNGGRAPLLQDQRDGSGERGAESGGLAPGVTVFRTLGDCRSILGRLGEVRRVAVLGGGLLGLEAARGLAGRGLEVEVVHPVDRLMERQLDPGAGRVLARSLRDLGVRTRLGVGAARYVAGPGRRLELTDGDAVEADLVVVSCGVRPNVGLAAEAGLSVERGIVVDDQLRSKDDDAVYAIGECAQHAGEVYGLVAPAWEQATVLAAVLTGEQAVYSGSRVVTRLKAADVDLAAMGDTQAEPDSDTDEVITFADPSRGSYQKIVIRDDRVAGAIMLGDSPAIGTVTQLFDRSAKVPRDRRQLFFGPGTGGDTADDPARLPDRVTVCRCNGVTKGAIAAAWQEGARSVRDVAECTRATTGCGTCRDAVEGIVGWLAATDPQEVAG